VHGDIYLSAQERLRSMSEIAVEQALRLRIKEREMWGLYSI